MIRRRVLLAAAIAFGVGIAAQADAQQYPNKPIKLIVPFAGRSDRHHGAAGRQPHVEVLVSRWSSTTGWASSTIGSRAVATAEADGLHAAVRVVPGLAVAPALVNLDRSGQAVRAGRQRLTAAADMVVPERVPAKNVAEFVAGQANAGAITAQDWHAALCSARIRARPASTTYVPYRGAAQSVTDMLGGRTHFTIDGTVILMPQIKAGKFRAIAMARPQRWPELPNVPTLVEQGYPDFVIDAWTGVVAPAGTPAPIVARLNTVINAGLATSESKATMDRFSSIIKTGTPQEFGAFVADQGKRWGALVKLSGAKVE
jgi:tripartite-type tricarboxylate transporter receptor subunit TctC